MLFRSFSKGLPFYVARPELLPQDQLAVSVVSNPSQRVGLATLLVVIDQPGAEDLTTVTLTLESREAPQRLVVTNPALGKPALVRLAILRDAGGTALMLGCVLSNEVEVRQVL